MSTVCENKIQLLTELLEQNYRTLMFDVDDVDVDDQIHQLSVFIKRVENMPLRSWL